MQTHLIARILLGLIPYDSKEEAPCAKPCDWINCGCASRCRVRQNPYPAAVNKGGWTERAQFIVDTIKECFTNKLRSIYGATRTEGCDPNWTGGHCNGNAIDAHPGVDPAQEWRAAPITGKGKENGDNLADCLVQNAQRLEIHSRIWYKQAWRSERSLEGWVPWKDADSNDPFKSDTKHIHISAYWPEDEPKNEVQLVDPSSAAYLWQAWFPVL